MNRSEHLLLRYVILGWEPVRALVAVEDNFYDWFNAAHHNLSCAEVLEALYRLFQEGHIIAQWRSREAPTFIPTRTQITRALAAKDIFDEELFDYGLTPQGGQQWEETAHPDWSRYLLAWTTVNKSSPEVTGEIVCVDYARAKQYFDAQGSQILWSEWDVVKPWQATYWKELRLGHRVRYIYDYPTDSTMSLLKSSSPEEIDPDWWTWFIDPD